MGLSAQETGYFCNPVIRGDVADPSLVVFDGTYYATGTSSEWAPFYPVFASKDLMNWTQTGHVFNEKPAWTSHSFWAPELFVHNGRVYCYYTARRAGDNISYIGVASAESPEHEFTDHGPLIEYGTEAIDAFVFDDGGQLYISWKAYGLDKRPIELLACKLSDDGLNVTSEPFTLLTDDGNIGMEGQYHFKKGDYYYIVYSAHGCCGPGSNYDVYAARSKSYGGPYEKYAGNPILHGGYGDYLSCGHGTAVETPDGRMFYMCHAYLQGDGFFMGRQPILQEMFVNDGGWPEFRTGRLAVAKQAVPFAGTSQKPLANFYDNFKGPELKVDWTWNYPYSDVDVRVKKGRLTLGGKPCEGTRNGSVLCLRPQCTDYAYETRVDAANDSFKGLVMYGDDSNLVMWGTAGEKLFLKTVARGKEYVVYESGCKGGTPWLKIEVRDGRRMDFMFSMDGKTWTKIDAVSGDAGSTIQWDRISRPGIIQSGDAPAEFSYFKMTDLK